MKQLKIIVTGFIGLYPTGGVTWDYIQYLLGLRGLGHDVYYIEDSGQYSHYRPTHFDTDEPLDSVAYLNEVMTGFGFGHRWAYRDFFTGRCYGMSDVQIKNLCNSADIFLNVSASAIYRPEYQSIPARVLIDSDPMFTQIQSLKQTISDGNDEPFENFEFNDYTTSFTFGENYGARDCQIPDMGVEWLATRQPVFLREWDMQRSHETKYGFSTVMNWSTRSKLVYNDMEWGQKDVEFERIIDFPKIVPGESFDLVLAVSSAFREQLNKDQITRKGWNVLPTSLIATADQYRNFIYDSLAEFSVAKETYVKGNTGWFSCRSACYLASGRPVISQETGWSGIIPQGEGLFAFTNMEEAKKAVSNIRENYFRHQRAARDLAIEYFDSEKVLTALLNKLS